MLKVGKEYTFNAPGGKNLSLSELFGDHDQLLVYHFMFKDKACRGCTHMGENLPDSRHMAFKNVSLACVSRGDVETLQAFKEKAGWQWPWYSTDGSDFNRDFQATVDFSKESDAMINFETKEVRKAGGKWVPDGPADVPGLSVFIKKDGDIYLAYSAWERGLDGLMTTHMLLDMVPLGRQDGENGPGEFRLPAEYEQK